uniref:Uncharacterized protein n=1 Tax=Arundo donax TaxID=35708 RepID=A0A0A8Y0T7_ARUDO
MYPNHLFLLDYSYPNHLFLLGYS